MFERRIDGEIPIAHWLRLPLPPEKMSVQKEKGLLNTVQLLAMSPDHAMTV
jgi:hypothetical protein